MSTIEPSIYRLSDIRKRPIGIVKSTRFESELGSYLVMEDTQRRIIVTGLLQILAQYGDVPAPFYIT